MAQPMWRSTSMIFSMDEVSRRVEVTRFSTPRMTPSEVETPMAVEPSLMASREYSTWKRRPSGEKVLGGGVSLGCLAGAGLSWGSRAVVSGGGEGADVLDAPI